MLRRLYRQRGLWLHRQGGVRLTGVDEASWSSFAELLGLIGQRDFHNSRDMSRGGLDPDGVRGDQLQKDTNSRGEMCVETGTLVYEKH